jgi:hypothetical protein
VYSVEGGLDPDDAAGWFGYDSGDALIRALERAPKRDDAIDGETDLAMRERHGDVLNDGAIEAEAQANGEDVSPLEYLMGKTGRTGR